MQSWINRKRACIPGAVYTSTPAYLPDPLFNFPRVWFRDYMYVSHVKPFQVILLAISCTSKEKNLGGHSHRLNSHSCNHTHASWPHIHILRRGGVTVLPSIKVCVVNSRKCSDANGQSPDNQLSQRSNSRKESVQVLDLQSQLWL